MKRIRNLYFLFIVLIIIPSFPSVAYGYENDAVNWIQINLPAVDNMKITSLVDFVPSPNYSHDATLFLLTYGTSKHCLWRSDDGGVHWVLILRSDAFQVTGLDHLGLSPQYGTNKKVLYVSGTSNKKPVLWRSEDGGETFSNPTISRDPDSGSEFPIDTFTVMENDTLIIGTYDGINGLVYHTSDGGLSYSNKAVAGTASLNSIAISPEYFEDRTILAGNRSGCTYVSFNGGISFEPLPVEAGGARIEGNISVAFDHDYGTNKTIFAANDVAGKGIFRLVIGKSTKWVGIDSSLPASSIINRLVESVDGVLYAINAKAGVGMERCLNPIQTPPIFETAAQSLESTAKLIGLWVSGNRLWSMDTANVKLLTIRDALNSPVILNSPEDKAAGIMTRNTTLNWDGLNGANIYRWQIDTDAGFNDIPVGFEGTTKTNSATLPALELGTTYYWRVRVTGPLLSPWSELNSFTTMLGDEVLSPKLIKPDFGAKVPLKPSFQWSQIAGAETYEVVIATDYTFSNPIVNKTGVNAMPTTAWQCDIMLNPDTTYYWKVRACGLHTYSSWSPFGIFITESLPASSSVVPAALIETKTVVVTQTISIKQNSIQPTVTVTTSAVSTSVYTTISISPSLITTQIVEIQQNIPTWLKWILYGSGLLFLALICFLTVVLRGWKKGGGSFKR
jgi:hypothetical protein